MLQKQDQLAPNEQLNSNYNITIEMLTPVHIGAGAEKKWFKYLDYIIRNHTVHVLDTNALYRILMQHDYNRLNALDYYSNLLSEGRLDRVENLLKDLNVDINKISLYRFAYNGSANEISPLIRNGAGKCYMPGSSIKGAIRSAIFNHLFTTSNARSANNQQIENELIGKFDQSIMRYIRPYDAQLLDETQTTKLHDVALYNLYNQGNRWISKYKQGFNIALETFDLDAKLSFRLSIANHFLDKIERYSPSSKPLHIRKIIKKDADPLTNLFSIINLHTQAHLEREIAFFEKHTQAEGTTELIELLTDFKEECKDNFPDSCILRMAWGSGFHAITGDWRFPDHLSTLTTPDKQNLVWSMTTRSREPARYKSRRLIDSDGAYETMGFVRLNL